MARHVSPRPTDSELAILRVLWQRGPCSIRAVHEEINRTRVTGYTTVLKITQIMLGKGLVQREDDQRTHIYRAAVPEQDTQQQLVKDLVDRAFGGSAQKLVMQALTATRATPKELAQISKLFDDYERGKS